MTQLRRAIFNGLRLIAVASLLLAGCSGDGSDTAQFSSSNVSQQLTNSATDLVDHTLGMLLGDHTGGTQSRARISRSDPRAPLASADQIVEKMACGSGELLFTGNLEVTESSLPAGGDNPFSLRGALGFKQCDGMNGEITLSSAGAAATSHITLDLTLSGTLQVAGCTMTFSPLGASTTANGAGLLTSPIFVSGKIEATCDEERVTCTLDSVDIDDSEAVIKSCEIQ